MPDILIRGGRIVDGTGETWYRGDVAVDGDTVTIHRGQQPGVDAGQVIDAIPAWSCVLASSTCTPTPRCRCCPTRTTSPS